jgi:hypothetical protein
MERPGLGPEPSRRVMAITPAAIPALKGADPQVLQDIKRAAAATSVDFGYLVAQAYQESSLKPDAKTSTSSATGLYQFTEGTWLREFQAHGAQYGNGNLAAKIAIDDAGRAHVSDPATRDRILALRNDPALSSELAAELAKENRSELETSLSRPVTGTDLYLAHFLGAGGARKLIDAIASNANTNAANILPAAASANPAVFYDDTGTPRSASAIYDYFAGKIDGQSRSYLAAAQPDGGHAQAATVALALQVAPTSPFAGSGSSAPTELGLLGGVVPTGTLSRHTLDQIALAALRTVRFGGGSQAGSGISPLSPAILPSSKSRKSGARPI